MSLLKSASTVSLFTLLSRITGLGRELLMASIFGASSMTDAFNVAFRIPNFLRRLFAEGAFSQAFVPVLAASRSNYGDETTKDLIAKVASILLWLLLITSVVGVLAAPALVWLMASGLNDGSSTAAAQMTRIMFPYIAFMSLVALGAGVLNTWMRYAIPAFTPVLLNVAVMLAIWLGVPWFQSLGIAPIYAVACGVMVGGVLQLSIQWWALQRLGLCPAIAWRWRDLRCAWNSEQVQKILNLMLPALLGVSVAQLSLLINTQIASHLAVGSVSWLGYADRLMEFPTAMLGVALGVVLTPAMAAAAAKSDPALYSRQLDWGLRLVLLFSLPCAMALLVFAKPLVLTLYYRGAFSAQDAAQTASALMGYGVGLLGLVAIKVLAPAYYAQQNTRTPVKIAISVLCITQLFNWVLVPRIGTAGLALSIGLGALVNAAWLLLGLIHSQKFEPQAGWLWFSLRVLIASCLLAAALSALAWRLDWLALTTLTRMGLMAAVVALGAGVYFVCLRLLGLQLRSLLKH